MKVEATDLVRWGGQPDRGLSQTAADASSRRDSVHRQGMAIKTIARTLGASRNSVRRWLRAGAFVPYRRVPAPSRLDAHLTEALPEEVALGRAQDTEREARR